MAGQVLSHLPWPAASRVSTYLFKHSKATISARAQPGLLQAALTCPSLDTQKGCQRGHHEYEATGNQETLPATLILLTSPLPRRGVCIGGQGWGQHRGCSNFQEGSLPNPPALVWIPCPSQSRPGNRNSHAGGLLGDDPRKPSKDMEK